MQLKPSANDIFAAVAQVHKRCIGGYAAVAMITGHGLVAFRDPDGIRPLVYGKRESAEGPEFMVASETVALDSLGFKTIDDVSPGEAADYVFLAMRADDSVAVATSRRSSAARGA